MSEERTYHVTLRLARAYEFVAQFNDVANSPSMLLDEPEPLGGGRGPSAASVLGAAVGNCLAASLAFCLRKSHANVAELTARVSTHLARNEKGRFRISGIDVALVPALSDADRARLVRCEQLFEDFCVVTESVRRGIPVNVSVEPARAATT